MHVLIGKDGENQHQEVADLDEAQALADAGHKVLVPNKDGGHRPLEAMSPSASPASKPETPRAPKAPAKKTAKK